MNNFRCYLILAASLLCLAVPATASGVEFVFDDEEGDTFDLAPDQHDILRTKVTITDTDVTFEVFFVDSISAPSSFQPDGVFGYIDLDLDRDATTGEKSNVSEWGMPPSGLGIEYFVELFSEGDPPPHLPGTVNLIDTKTNTLVTTLPIAYTSNPQLQLFSVSLSVPFIAIGGDPGTFSFGVVVGTLYESTDQLVASVVPEPTSLAVWCPLALGLLVFQRRRRRSSRT